MDTHARFEDVPLSQARATQTSMDWRPQGVRKNPGPLVEGYGQHPVAARKEDGEYLIFDGHHRAVMAMNSGRDRLGMHVIDVKRYNPESAGRPPARQGMSNEELMAELTRPHKAEGGSIGSLKLHTGPIHSPVAGRTDHLPMHVPSGAYVIPADIISAMGEGNTMAGFKHMRRMFAGNPYGGGEQAYGHEGGPYSQGEPPYDQGGGPYGEALPGKACGGQTDAVPIVAAGGEYVLSPAEVRYAGGGDLDLGHRVLDEFVKRMRAETVKTLSKLPGPKKD